MFRSEDGGATWIPDSLGLGSSRIWSLVQHPVSGVLYAGTEPANLYRKRPGATSWEPCSPLSALPRYREWTSPHPPHHEPRVRGIGLDPERPHVIAAAIEVGWIVLSRDGGETWENLTEGSEFDSHSVLFSPGQPEVLLSTSGHGFFRSDDGVHFRSFQEGLDRDYLSPLVMHPARPKTLYVYAARTPPPSWFNPEVGADGAFYRSDDQGGSWRRVGQTPFLQGGSWTACGDASDPETFCVGLTDGSVWLTRDGGEHFERILDGLGLVSVVSIPTRRS
ncbi:WD40/YVTN/BNR-like repeat-containing protein [Melittangium boletus]|uniref:WD40/YVTN/BNR-like repeat-containing protein n=1 Tax=Melittangium boletus TaxID=83453 RepID=UPI001FEBAB88|nr:hypothetical protein [Melittangium boletus]